MPRRSRTCLREELADVAHPLGEALGPVVGEQPAELLQVRSAAGRVHDDQIDVLEGVDEAPREALALLEPPRVHRERTAAALRRRHDLEAIRGEDARGGGVHVGEHGALHAAGEEADSRARGAFGRSHACDLALPAPRRRHVHERAESPRQRQRPPDRGEVERDAHARRIGQDAEEEPADEAVAHRAQHLLLDDGAGALDQAVVADARRARRHARHAPEAAVEVLGHGCIELDRAVETRVHQVDASARRVHLLVPEDVGRARRKAEPAVDAIGGVLADHGRSEVR